PPPPPPGSDWFDKALSDAGERSLARTVSGDGSIDRLDMLALFAQAAKDGVISANEIHDLKALEKPDWTAGGTITQPKTLFTMPNSVRVLTSDVVDGDPANAHYQGALLGNLQAGWSAAQFQKLVNKWFLGLDHPVAEAGATYQRASGSLFVNGPAMTDVQQGNLGDCYFLAAAGALAFDQPASIPDMFTDNGDGTFTVRFFDAGVARYVTVDRALPADASGRLVYDGAGASVGSAGNELWVALAEKAYAQMNEEGWLGHAAANSYPAIQNGFSDDSLKQISNGATSWTQLIRTTPAQLQAEVAAAKPAILNSLASPGNGVIGSHTYPVVGFDATTQRFNLFNPQGGFIQLTWTQITQSFSGFWQM
ncbi:MAG TPA: C2 family cysteine protease, partial [Gemmataceae bacterium]|nr:C2 family cysteine protease [Gemmataceae bacterium]